MANGCSPNGVVKKHSLYSRHPRACSGSGRENNEEEGPAVSQERENNEEEGPSVGQGERIMRRRGLQWVRERE